MAASIPLLQLSAFQSLAAFLHSFRRVTTGREQ